MSHWLALCASQLVDEDSDDHDSVAEGASVVMTAEEMRAYCQRQIARYTRVIEMIDKYPQCFPQPGKSEEDEVAELLSQTYLDAAQINQGKHAVARGRPSAAFVG
eukprot:scaffold303_cov410-Prasinococcus_capsulatus_cf.AAC.2